MDKDLLAVKRETAASELIIDASQRQANSNTPPSLDNQSDSMWQQTRSNKPTEDIPTYQASSNSPSPANNNINSSSNNNTKNKKLFPQKLWDLINDDKYNFCLRWSDDGQLVYLNRDDFEDSYLKTTENQFHTQKAISFVRQMNMYGFRKVDDCYYENDNFKRDCKHLLKNMIRKHPNKSNLQQNDATEITPYLYANNSTASATAAQTLLQSSAAAAAAASLLAPSHHHLHRQQQQHLNLNHQNNEQFTFMDYRQRLNQQFPIYNNITNDRSQLLNGGNTLDSIIAKTNDSGHLLRQAQQKHLLEEERSSNDDSLSSTGDYCCSAGSSQGDTSIVNVLDKIESVENSSTTRLQQQQLIDTHYPRDLSTTSSKTNQHLNIQQPDNSSNLNAFYALLSSINNSMYQPSAQMQAHQNLAYDINRFSSLQQIYQQILTTTTSPPTIAQLNQISPPIVSPNCGSNNTTVTHSYGTQQQPSLEPTKRMNGIALRNPTSDNDTSSLSTSLLMRNKFSVDTAQSGLTMEMFENGYKDGCHLNERSHERPRDNKQQQKNYDDALGKPISDSDSDSLAGKRRDNKLLMTNRLFKRSVDSILDSNNNIANAGPEYRTLSGANKRVKVDSDNEEFVDVQLDEDLVVSDYAKNLVAQVALGKDACFDPNVISEASKFTQRFVETLFDTAQVIARHSNNSGPSLDPIVSSEHSSPSPGGDKNAQAIIEKPRAINLHDLNSALKLLPSKISKLLK